MVSDNCATIEVSGIDFTNFNNVQSSVLKIYYNRDLDTPVKEYEILPTPEITVTAGVTTLNAMLLGLEASDTGMAITDGLWTFELVTVDRDVALNDATYKDITCAAVLCVAKCKKGLAILQDSPLADTIKLILSGVVAATGCEKCISAIEGYSLLKDLLNSTDCNCQ